MNMIQRTKKRYNDYLAKGQSADAYFNTTSQYGGRRHKSWTCASKALTLLSEDSPGMKDPRVIF